VKRRQVVVALASALAGGAAPAADEPTALERIRTRGRLTVAVYQEMPPFHVDGKGIDVDIADALAKAMGLTPSLLPFPAGENMGDDLRNMVWRGHYLGYGPADVMLHVPVDAALMRDNPRVAVLAPYYRERVQVARDRQRIPALNSLDDLAGQRIAVAGQSLAGWLLIGAEGGRLREQLVTTWPDGAAAAQALRSGEVAAAAGHASELESVLGGDPRFAIEPLPLPRLRDGWVIGCAVRREAGDLALAVQTAMSELDRGGALAAVFARAHVDWRRP
jgi:ABC-type amino acid transport substrate-binding protein